jgi:23S rRNA (uracil1939-C5)-methyltransferase
MTLSNHPDCNPNCRACHYKALDYPTQLRRKQDWAARQLHPWQDRLQSILPAPDSERLGYRAKSWMRAEFQQGELSLGMFRAVQINGKWDEEFISWDSCPLHNDPMRETITRLREALASSKLAGIWFGSPHIMLVSRDPDAGALAEIDWAPLLAPPFNRVWFHQNPQIGARVFSHLPIRQLAGPPINTETHPIRAFRQAAQTLLAQARAQALQHLLKPKPRLILDLYCGTGELALALPPETAWLGIEQSRDAVAYANQIRPGSAYVGAVEQRLNDPRVLEKIRAPYSLYVNPPRSGLSPEARERLARLPPPDSIAYLSCSASSLARDLPHFRNFAVEFLQPYDFFPQTEHFETLALLKSD